VQVSSLLWTNIESDAHRLALSRSRQYEEVLLNPSVFCELADALTPRDLSLPMKTLVDVGVSFGRSPASRRPVLLVRGEEASVKQVAALIKRHLHRRDYDEFKSLAAQGATLRAIPYEDLSPPQWMRLPHLFTEFSRRFAMLAQTGQISCGANLKLWGQADSAECKLCGKYESTAHVLNGCEKRLPIYTRRHNAGLKVLVKELRKTHPTAEIRVDTTLPREVSSSILRPDIVILFPAPRSSRFKYARAMIVDFKVPFPKLGIYESKHAANVQKYQPLADEIAAHTESGTCPIFTLSIMSVGPNHASAVETLLGMGIRRRTVNRVLSDLSATVCRQNACLAVGERALPPQPLSEEEEVEDSGEQLPHEEEVDPAF
jgi:hypothetical protein